MTHAYRLGYRIGVVMGVLLNGIAASAPSTPRAHVPQHRHPETLPVPPATTSTLEPR